VVNLLLRSLLRLEDRCDSSLCPTHSPFLLLRLLQLSNTLPSLVRRDFRPAKSLKLFLPHSRIDVDVLDFDVERTMLWNSKPRPSLPANVQNKEEGTCKIVLEKRDGAEVGPADGPKRDVELGG